MVHDTVQPSHKLLSCANIKDSDKVEELKCDDGTGRGVLITRCKEALKDVYDGLGDYIIGGYLHLLLGYV